MCSNVPLYFPFTIGKKNELANDLKSISIFSTVHKLHLPIYRWSLENVEKMEIMFRIIYVYIFIYNIMCPNLTYMDWNWTPVKPRIAESDTSYFILSLAHPAIEQRVLEQCILLLYTNLFQQII